MVADSLATQELFEKMCSGKERFPSESAASAALKMYRKSKTLDHPSALSVYQCHFGEHWHIGH